MDLVCWSVRLLIALSFYVHRNHFLLALAFFLSCFFPSVLFFPSLSSVPFLLTPFLLYSGFLNSPDVVKGACRGSGSAGGVWVVPETHLRFACPSHDILRHVRHVSRLLDCVSASKVSLLPWPMDGKNGSLFLSVRVLTISNIVACSGCAVHSCVELRACL